MTDALGLLALLIGLEIVLGVDNVLVIAIFVGRLPENQRQKARIVGLSVAMIARIVMLAVVVALASLTRPIVANFSVRDLILLAGGLFLLYKAVHEIHHTVEFRESEHGPDQQASGAFASIITQIVLLDIVFSVDSVITAVGLTQQLWIIVSAVVLSFVGILFFARPIGDFILRHPALKILALSFLITIGVTIFMEGLHKHVPKAYIYLPMGFALMVEMLQMRYEQNRHRKKA
ncbi:TerC family protein [Desulfosarcina sp.]|uniref:TerC family protein n=1 Tax=Desulfosarcina sp. TaxID=2027861 RepID=UPI0029BC05EC|nr:TerC family protein [Desulfosarcina sp.]MDX2453629.1 TerC family protein [Desulfosarcina sp.]MDX2491336.1 TerC family protein [Desulfosarcina sp.]